MTRKRPLSRARKNVLARARRRTNHAAGRTYDDVQRQVRAYLRSRGLTPNGAAIPIGRGVWSVYVVGRQGPLEIRDSMLRAS